VLPCLALFGLDACGPGGRGSDRGTQHTGGELLILAGPEQKALEFLQPQMEAAVGRPLRFEYAGMVGMVDRIDAGKEYELAWPASSRYVALAVPGRISAQAPTMLSPVLLGLKQDRVRQLGWDRHQPHWDEIVHAIRREKLLFGMSNPAASSAGWSALMGLAAATSGAGAARRELEWTHLRGFFDGVRLTSGTSSWLAEAYAREEERLDGLIDYESELLALNTGDQLNEPLVPIYPREGAVIADFPLLLLKAGARPAYDKLLAFLRRPEIQREIMQRTFRRPLDRTVKPLPQLEERLPAALALPDSAAAAGKLLDAYLDELRPPSHAYFLLDVSGSMSEGLRMDELQTALRVLGGADTATEAGRYATFRFREKVDLIAFDSRLQDQLSVDFGDREHYDQALAQYTDYVQNLAPKGGSAIFDALQAAYQRALDERRRHPECNYSIVLLVDGKSSVGKTFEQFREWYEALPEPAQHIPIFTILFADGDEDELQTVAEISGGRLFDARQRSLAAVFKELRGYQ
jgi:Ca-activated chloride channel family protein